MGAVHIIALVEDGELVGFRITIGVFDDQDAVAFLALAVVAAVVHHLAHPHATTCIDVDAARAEHHRLTGEELHLQLGMHLKACDGILWIARAGVRGFQRSRILGVNREGHAGATALLGATFVQHTPRDEALRPRRQEVFDHAVRMRADAIRDVLSMRAQRLATRIGIHPHIAEARLRLLPLDVGELLLLAIGHDQPWLRPVGPITRKAIAAIGDDEKQFLRTGDIHINVHRISRCLDINKLGLESGLGCRK